MSNFYTVIIPRPKGVPDTIVVRIVAGRADGKNLTEDDLKALRAVYPNTEKAAKKPKKKSKPATKPQTKSRKTTAKASAKSRKPAAKSSAKRASKTPPKSRKPPAKRP